MADVSVETRLRTLEQLIRDAECREHDGVLKVGVDLGTANIAMVVVDRHNPPITGITYPSSVVKDGIVVDYLSATRVVKHLKQQLEARLGQALTHAATAIPPGISEGNTKVIANVVESSGLLVTHVVDEPVAAATALNMRNGAVVDVGGGTTGLSVLRNGKVLFSADEPTGGTHMTLVLAGALGLTYADAEQVKHDPAQEADIFPLVRPVVVEKMACLTRDWLTAYNVRNIHVVGGASSFSEFPGVFRKVTGKNIIPAVEPLLVTPLGIAMQAAP
ncbi:MAG: ethanolamine utilization protein EutJ [Candidatus Symbiopectobacterium sp. Clec_Harlan]|nr:ethanolamine utilization protein EutJ [Candidatus Symbiopectobacterium sp. Clec_Harlan]